MKEIIVHDYLFYPTFVSLLIVGLLIYLKKEIRTKTNRDFWISLLVFFIIYMAFVGSALFRDIYYQWDLNGYYSKINESGKIIGTPEYDKALKRFSNDTGRTFSPITGILKALIISFSLYFILFYKKKRIKNKLNLNENG